MDEPASVSLQLVLDELNSVINSDLQQKCEQVPVANSNCVAEVLSFLVSIRELLLHLEKLPEVRLAELKLKLGRLGSHIKHLQMTLNKYKSKRRLFWSVYCISIRDEVQGAMRAIEKTLVSIQLEKPPLSQEARDQFDDLIHNMSKKHFEVNGEQRLGALFDEKATSDLGLNAVTALICRTLGLNIERDKVQLCQELRYLKHDLAATGELSDEQKRLLSTVERVLDAEEEKLNALEAENEVLPPFDSFECPLLKEIMEDPVVLHSEHTYERRGIEEWFKNCREQNREPICPVTGKVLTSTDVLPNLVLRQTIEEWYQRNVTIRINILRQKLRASDSNQDVEVALDEVLRLATERRLNKFKLKEGRLVPDIVKVWNLNDASSVRGKALAVLTKMATDDVENQHAMVDNGVVRLAVKSLGSNDVEERVNAARLVSQFSEQPDICSKLVSEKGAIIHLDKLTGSTNEELAALAERTLKNMEHDSNVAQMAEAGRLQPLLSRLCSGSEETQIEMAKYLATKVTVKRLTKLSAKHASHVLVEMLSRGLDAKEAGLGALLNLSSYEGNIPKLIKAGLLPLLLSIMFSIQSSLNARSLKLKEDAASVLATLVTETPSPLQPAHWEGVVVDDDGNTLDSEFVIHNILGLLAHLKPNWRASLLQVIYGIASSPRVADAVCKHVCSGNGLAVLMPLLQSSETSHKLNALKVLSVTSLHMGTNVLEAVEQAGEFGRMLNTVKYGSTGEQAAAAALVSNLPLSEEQVIRYLGRELIGWIIGTILEAGGSSKQGRSFVRLWIELEEGLLGILVHFVKCKDKSNVEALKEQDVMAVLLKQLQKDSQHSSITKQRSLVALRHLSEKAPGFNRIPERKHRTTLLTLLSAICVGARPVTSCPVHGGLCAVAHSFCLVENNGVVPLLEMLEDEECVQLACVEALSTLLSDSVDSMKAGVDVLVTAQGTRKILDLLYADPGEALQERLLWIVERLLRCEDISKSLSMEPGLFKTLVDAFKNGSPAAKVLAQDALTHLKLLSGVSARPKLEKSK